MSRQDAEDVIEKMAKYDDFFVNLMMNEELGLQVCTISADPLSLGSEHPRRMWLG